jgi:asparagine synthase (glutamine-hydrolysing)
MVKILDRPVITNSIGFEDPEANELSVAAMIARHLGTDHREHVVIPDAGGVLEKIAWHFDEPQADSSALPTWYVCQMTRQAVTVAISGDGGDEAFAGYSFRYRPHQLESRIRGSIPAALRTLAFGPLGCVWPRSARLPRFLRLKTILENLSVDDAQAYYRDLAWLREDDREQLYSPGFMADLRGFSPFEVVRPFYARSDAPDALGRAQDADIHVYMTDDVLAKVDRMSMAHSLEVRSPLLDYRILEFAAGLPSALKIDGGRGKLPLRELARQRLPPQIEKLPKRGFSVPAARWLREELASMAGDAIFQPNGLVRQVMDDAALRKVWEEHQSRSRDHSVLLWGLMMLGFWEHAR